MIADMICLTLKNVCVTNDHGYAPLVVIKIRVFPRSCLFNGLVTIATRRVSLREFAPVILLVLVGFVSFSTFLVRCCDVSCNCRVKKVLGSSLPPLYMFCYVICIYSCILALPRFPYQRMCVSF
jgi:hypothetical protein